MIISEDLPISEGEDLCFDLIARGCLPRLLRYITDVNGLGNLVHQVGIASIDTITNIGKSANAHDYKSDTE